MTEAPIESIIATLRWQATMGKSYLTLSAETILAVIEHIDECHNHLHGRPERSAETTGRFVPGVNA